jgi:hypothetical protein
MNKETWLTERRKGIGASEAAAVLGLSRYKSPLDVYLDKTGEIGPQDDSERMYWGRKLEGRVTEMKEITSRYLQDIGACQDAREQFRKELNGGRSLSVSRVFTRLKQIDRMDWANWLIVRLMTHEQQIRYAIYAAEQVISLYEEKYPEDKRPRQAIEAARLCLDNPSEENKAAARSAAESAWSAWSAAEAAAWSAWSAAESAAWSARSAAESAWSARSAAEAAARSAATSAWSVAWSAAAAAARSAATSAWSVARSAAALKKMQLKIINYGLRLIGVSAPKQEAHP